MPPIAKRRSSSVVPVERRIAALPTRAAQTRAGATAVEKKLGKQRGARAERSKDRLGRDDWIASGQVILRKSGISAVKLSALTARLGVSIGSFYHHFTNFEQYLGALADSHSADTVQREIDFACEKNASPVERIRRLSSISLKEGTWDLHRAIRVWASMDARAEKSLRRAEKLVLDFLNKAFRDMGFSADEAALRARILLSVNIAANLDSPDSKGLKTQGQYLKNAFLLLTSPRTSRARI
jgi:AcrR family transcriptional regulator